MKYRQQPFLYCKDRDLDNHGLIDIHKPKPESHDKG